MSLAGQLLRQLLRQRGRDVSADTVRLLREHRAVEQKRPEETNTGLIRWGYLAAVLGGFGAIFMGWQLYSHKDPHRRPAGARLFGPRPGARHAHYDARVGFAGILGGLPNLAGQC